jgi:hypothetical protein
MFCLGLVKYKTVCLRMESPVKDASRPGHVQDSVWPMSGLVPSVLGTSIDRQRIYSGCLVVKLSLNRLVIKKWQKLSPPPQKKQIGKYFGQSLSGIQHVQANDLEMSWLGPPLPPAEPSN